MGASLDPSLWAGRWRSRAPPCLSSQSGNMDLETLSPAASTSEGVSSFGRGPTAVFGAHFPTSEKPLTSLGGYSALQAALGSPSLFFQGGARSGFPALSESPPPTPGKRELGSHPPPGLRAEPVDGACRH